MSKTLIYKTLVIGAVLGAVAGSIAKFFDLSAMVVGGAAIVIGAMTTAIILGRNHGEQTEPGSAEAPQ